MNKEEIIQAAITGDLICPFCTETGFDKPGLKDHLNRYCEEYHDTENI